MATNSKIRVGIVGASPSRGFASIAHIPALQALPDFEIALYARRGRNSAEAAARHFGVPLAFSDPEKLAQHPDVDLVTVSVKVPDHYRPVMAAIEAGKHVYCEWPLGRDTDEALGCSMPRNAEGSGMRSGCRARCRRRSTTSRTLVAQGYVGRVLTATMIGVRAELGSHDRPGLPGRPSQWRQPADDHRRSHDRCFMPLPRRISRTYRFRRQSA